MGIKWNFDASVKNSDAAQPRVTNVKTPILSVWLSLGRIVKTIGIVLLALAGAMVVAAVVLTILTCVCGSKLQTTRANQVSPEPIQSADCESDTDGPRTCLSQIQDQILRNPGPTGSKSRRISSRLRVCIELMFSTWYQADQGLTPGDRENDFRFEKRAKTRTKNTRTASLEGRLFCQVR